MESTKKVLMVTLENDCDPEPMDFWLYACPACGYRFLGEGKGEPLTCPMCHQGRVPILSNTTDKNYRFVGSGNMVPRV